VGGRQAATLAILGHTHPSPVREASIAIEGQDNSIAIEGRDNPIARVTFMKFTNRVRLIFIFCLATAGASSAEAQMQSREEFVCTSGSVKRVVAILNGSSADGKRGSGGCRVDYTRDGATKTVWTSKTDYAYCVAKAVSLVTKLSEGNFSCKPESIERPDAVEPSDPTPRH
jgi:hypothetical protein